MIINCHEQVRHFWARWSCAVLMDWNFYDLLNFDFLIVRPSIQTAGHLPSSQVTPRLVCFCFLLYLVPLVLQHCWLCARKSIMPVNTEWWDVSLVICLEWGAECLHMAWLMQWCHCHPKTLSSLTSLKSGMILCFFSRLPKLCLMSMSIIRVASVHLMNSDSLLWAHDYGLMNAFSALTLLVGRQEEHLSCKNWVMMC